MNSTLSLRMGRQIFLSLASAVSEDGFLSVISGGTVCVLFIMFIRDLVVAQRLIHYSTSSVEKIILAGICVLAVFIRLFFHASFGILIMESMLLLMEILGCRYLKPDRTSGLFKSHIGMIPTANYGSVKVDKSCICSICLELIEDEDEVCIPGSCKHYYHISCIEKWLQRSKCCPICRRDVTHHNGIKSNSLSSSRFSDITMP